MFLRRFFRQFIVLMWALTNKVTFIFESPNSLKRNNILLMIFVGIPNNYLYAI